MIQQSPTISANRTAETSVSIGGSTNRRRLASKLSEIILGGQDGLVNVAGVILGLAAATSDTRIIIAGGLAATFAESISMAAVAYTSTLANKDYYSAEVKRQKEEIKQAPEIKRGQVARLFQSWGFSGAILDEAVEHMTQNDGHWADLLVANDLKLQPVEENGLLGDSILVGVSAVIGSFIPLWPFFFFPPETAIWLGLLFTAVTLYALGAVKAKLTVGKPSRSGLQMLVIGMLAALVGYIIGLFFAL
jgi:VIT1/CCC1 family predicted Fe2+/Mn2+ transporter